MNKLIKKAVWGIIFVLVSTAVYAKETYQDKFIKFMLSKTQLVNKEIKQSREKLLTLKTKYLKSNSMTTREQQWVKRLANKYDIKSFSLDKKDEWKRLEKRVDVVPNSMAIAQAVYESNWGRSRFAREGNNFYGQRCYEKNCGIIPKSRAKGARFEVRKFATPLNAVKSYMHNLNTQFRYNTFRELRYETRKKGDWKDAWRLTDGLNHYSQQTGYIKGIQEVIKRYDLIKYDLYGL